VRKREKRLGASNGKNRDGRKWEAPVDVDGRQHVCENKVHRKGRIRILSFDKDYDLLLCSAGNNLGVSSVLADHP
jgi:hypothetical protein